MTIADAVVERLPIAVYAIDDDRFVYVKGTTFDIAIPVLR